MSESLTAQRRIRKCALRAEGHPQTGVASDTQAKKHSRQLFTLKHTHTACADVPKAHSSLQQSQQDMWLSSLPFQRFQAPLTLFPKSFSSFPHGTCSLSVSSLYLALDEIYHLIYAPIPRSVTLRTSAVDSGPRAKHRILTRAHALFQEAYARTADSTMPAGYIPKPKLQFPA